MKGLFAAAAIASFFALAPLPIGYYTFLRILVALASLVIVFKTYSAHEKNWMLFFILVTILYNPLIPVYFHQKLLWMPLNVAVGVAFLIYGVKPGSRIKKNKEGPAQIQPQDRNLQK